MRSTVMLISLFRGFTPHHSLACLAFLLGITLIVCPALAGTEQPVDHNKTAVPKVAASVASPVFFKGEVVFLGGTRAKDLHLPVVAFDHAAHAKDIECSRCHVVQKSENNGNMPRDIAEKPAFSGFNGILTSDPEQRKRAYHAACVNCHTEKGSSPALAQCRTCHTRGNTALLPGDSPFKPVMDVSLHRRHLLSDAFPAKPGKDLAPGAIMAENDPQRCAACHHPPLFNKDLSPELDACRACHQSGPGSGVSLRKDWPTPPHLRMAAHETCLRCHAELATQKKAHGPLDCDSCHNKERFEALPRIEGNPSLLTMDRPTGLMLTPRIKTVQQPLGAVYPTGPEWPTSMPVVPFNHGLHERSLNCVDCHHSSVKQACITCHTPYGDPRGKGITLTRIMHSVTAKNSCVSCHARIKTAAPECRGCHQTRPIEERGTDCAFCHRAASGVKATMGLMLASNLPEPQVEERSVETTAPPKEQVRRIAAMMAPQPEPKLSPTAILLPGTESKLGPVPEPLLAPTAIRLPPSEPRQDPAPEPLLAPSAILLPPSMPGRDTEPESRPLSTDIPVTPAPAMSGKAPVIVEAMSPLLSLGPIPDNMPGKVRIGAMIDEYLPVEFEHAKHLEKLQGAIGRQASGLLSMHRKDGRDCAACHHHGSRIEPGGTPPRCGSCHMAKLPGDKTSMPDGRPLLKAAFHLRCMDCHKRMGLEKPGATDCVACHAKKDSRIAQGE